MAQPTRPLPTAPDRGITLVVVLILMAVIGLTAAAAMRSAVTQEKVVNNLRVEFAAQTRAEQALRFCEGEVMKPSGHRVSELQGVEHLVAQPVASLRWRASDAWAAPLAPATDGTPAAGGTPSALFLTLAASLVPGGPPAQCLVERMQVANSQNGALVVTARGFSPDYVAGSSGSVVWLQSFLYLASE